MADNQIQFTFFGVDKLSKTIKAIGSKLASLARHAVSAAKYIAATATAMLAFATVTLKGEDAVAKFATRIGVATDDLSSMQFAASQAGISIEQYNMAVQRMTRRVSEASVGMGEAVSALNELGINAKQFKQLGLEDQMAVLADSINSVKDPSDKLRLAFKLFDSEGTSMLQMLKGGSKAMQEAARDAEFLGLVIDKQAAANAEHFSDSLGRATGAMKGVSRAVSNELAPLLSGLANNFADALAGSRSAIVVFVRQVVTNLFVFYEVIKQVIEGVRKAFSDKEGFEVFLRNVGAFIVSAGKAFYSLGKIIFTAIWEGLKAAADVLTEFGKWVWKKMKSWFSKDKVGDLSTLLAETITDALTTAATAIADKTKEPLEDFKANATEASHHLANTFGVDMEAARANAEAMIQSLLEFGEVAANQVGETGARVGTMFEELNIASNEFMMMLQERNKAFAEGLFNVLDQTITSIGDAMAASIVDGQNLMESFKNIGKQILKSIISLLIQVGIKRLALSLLGVNSNQKEAAVEASRAIAGAGANAVMSTAAAPYPINLTAPAVGAATQAAAATLYQTGIATGTGLSAGITGARETGGSVMGGSTYVVNEKRQELFTPRVDGTISPDAATAGTNLTIENMQIDILPNATNAEALLDMDSTQLKEFVEYKIVDALDELAREGVKPYYAR